MGSCATGTCERSKDHGGPGCDMCDRVAKLPQPKFRSKDALVEDVFEAAAGEEAGPAAPPVKKPTAPRKPAVTATKRRPDKGPQTGSLLDYEPD